MQDPPHTRAAAMAYSTQTYDAHDCVVQTAKRMHHPRNMHEGLKAASMLIQKGMGCAEIPPRSVSRPCKRLRCNVRQHTGSSSAPL